MKRTSIRVTLSITILFAVFLVILSCGPGAENVSKNQNQAADLTNANLAVADSEDPCRQTTVNDKKNKLITKVLGKINGDKVLERQYHGYSHYEDPDYQNEPPRFEFQVTEGQFGAVEIHFKGDVSGEGKLEALVDFLDDYKKKGCLEKVTFTPGPVKSGGGTTKAAAFQWSFCEWPKVACPSGECSKPPCVSLSPTPKDLRSEDSNTSSNANMNSNSGRGNN